MQQVTFPEEGKQLSLTEASAWTSQEETSPKHKHAARFVEWDRASQLAAFFTWLPKALHDAPRIDWSQLPPQAIGYCVRSIGDHPDAASLALTAASLLGAVDRPTLVNMLGHLTGLLRELRAEYHMEQIADLSREHLWNDFAVHTELTMKRRNWLKTYSAVSSGHFPRYLQRLDPPDRHRMQIYAFPPFPPGFLKRHAGDAALQAVTEKKRKAQSDILVPFYPVLRQLVRLRKQLAERTFKAIREARNRVESGNAELPYSFEHTDVLPFVNRDARTISEVQIQGREVTMHFTLWDKCTWVDRHMDRYSPAVIDDAKARRDSYTQELNRFFVQYHGKPANLLWFGDLVEHRLFQYFTSQNLERQEFLKRKQLARSLGFSNGCLCSRTGILNPGDQWLSRKGEQGEMLFEPESLYRGVLMGATLATIALSNGSRVSELLQVSFDRRVTHTETVTVLGKDGRPIMGEDGKAKTKQVKMHLQYLLPKGSKTEEERQCFPLSKEAVRLLGEIKEDLEQTYGAIPVVEPSRTSTKYEHLKPERYFFQWDASHDGKYVIIGMLDVQILLRFLLHGLELYTTNGEPIRVTTHLLRHVMATDARQYHRVPAEAIASFFLHHRLKTLSAPTVSIVSDYYFQMTQDHRLALIREYLDEQEVHDRALVVTSPTPRDLEQMNEDLQMVYERWHTLHPTVFGNCGCPGLCPSGNDRLLCLGCPYLVEDYEKRGAALAWRMSYARQAELLEAQGNRIDARQARIKVQQLNDIMNVMQMQKHAEADGRYIPLYKVLPSPYRKTEANDEEEIE